MTDLREQGGPHPSVAETAFEIFQRIIAVFCLVVGVRYWALLIGVMEQGTWRFDLLAVHWKIAAASLAVLWPVAGIGLWMLVSWGPVVWLVAAAIEVAMHGAFSDIYGSRWLLVTTHLAVALLYAVFRLVLYFSVRRAELDE